MPSSYSTDLKLELMATGENSGTWGDNTNNNLNLIQQAIAGYESVTITDSATTALVMTNATISNARNMVIKFATITLTGATTVTIPDGIEKFYIFDCSGITAPTNLTIKTVSGTGFTIDAAKIYAAYSDGTNLNEISLDTLGGTIGSAQIAASAVTTAKIADDAVTTAKIADANVTTAKIANTNITTALIADDAVTADKLADTAVTPGSYTAASITVDAQGRLTAASSGAAGGGDFLQTVYTSPATFTKQPGTSALRITVIGGGGGGCPRNQSPGANAAGGGGGGYAVEYLDAPAVPGPVAVTVGTGGAATGSPTGQGSAGGTSSFGAFLSATGGQGNCRCNGGGAGGSGSGGNINLTGNNGQQFTTGASGDFSIVKVNKGGMGSAGPSAPYGYGVGGSQNFSGSYNPGQAGSPGVVVVEEYF